MSQTDPPLTDELLDLAAGGDAEASERLLDRHRDRLRKMVSVRLDSRLAARIDPSDVVQETLLVASQRLPVYLTKRPIAFYPWLRQLASDQLERLHRQHIQRQNRAVGREVQPRCTLSNQSLERLVGRFVAKDSSPSRRLLRKELREQVQAALELMDNQDREILILRFLEQLTVAEVAEVLGLSEGAVNMRQLRALERLRALLGTEGEEYNS